jgi:hypothetical protein
MIRTASRSSLWYQDAFSDAPLEEVRTVFDWTPGLGSAAIAGGRLTATAAA